MLGFGQKKTQKAHGIDLINEVADRFSDMVHELDRGVEECREEQAIVNDEIAQLHVKNTNLEYYVKRASGIASNLRSLLGE